ncbi:MAG TPA: hypothetical protein VHT70_04665 [Candidatus Saccharimonadales bacterium]|jgi:hypothetical protein|nr:hypothetical protein [Candidatus Saccharimonadales bacterium]
MKEFEQQPAPVELVSWDAVQNLGEIEGSGWVCPDNTTVRWLTQLAGAANGQM